MNTPTDRRIALGLLVQPFLAFGLGAAIAAVRLATETRSNHSSDTTAHVMLSSGIIVGVYAIGASSVAYFLILWLRDRGQVTLVRALIAGFVLGILPVALIGIAARAAGDERAAAAPLVSWVPGLALASFLGLAGAGLFWLIACRHPAPHADDGPRPA